MSNKNFLLKSINTKLVALFLAVSIFPILLIGILSINSARSALENLVFNQLEAVGTIKMNEITMYLNEVVAEAEIFATLPFIKDAILELDNLSLKAKSNGYSGKRLLEYSPYKTAFDKYSEFIKQYEEKYGFYDIFLFSPNSGRVIYSAELEDDFGTELKDMNTHLADAWQASKRNMKVVITDFELYKPSNDQPAMFIVVPSIAEGNYLGSIGVQVSLKQINEIMQERTGLGESGETYLVGSDFLMRSDSRFDTESSILNKLIETESTRLGLQNRNGIHIIQDYRDIKVLSYYSGLGLKEKLSTDFNWVIVAEMDESEAFSSSALLTNRILIIGIIIAVIVVVISFLFARNFSNPIIKLTDISRLFAIGDLRSDIDIQRNDEIGVLSDSFKLMQQNLIEKTKQAEEIASGNLILEVKPLSNEDTMGIAFAAMVNNLRSQLEEITEGVNVLSSASSEIMAAVSQLSSSAAETVTSISETTSTIEEVKQTADVSNLKATQVSDGSKQNIENSQKGTKSLEDTIEGMNRIKQQMESIAGIVVRLSEQSQSIGEIAATVNDLAEQSNLLAVNASIEAAKAGEQGKGFAVVAQEIKNLAERSKESTGQIRNILNDIQKAISSAVMATEQGGKAVDEGLELSSIADEVIKALAKSIDESAQANIQIASSSQQQLVGMDQIAVAMENIKEASVQTAASTKQSEESVSDLHKLGEKLQDILKLYKLK